MILERERPFLQVEFYANGTSYVYMSYPDGHWSVRDNGHKNKYKLPMGPPAKPGPTISIRISP